LEKIGVDDYLAAGGMIKDLPILHELHAETYAKATLWLEANARGARQRIGLELVAQMKELGDVSVDVSIRHLAKLGGYTSLGTVARAVSWLRGNGLFSVTQQPYGQRMINVYTLERSLLGTGTTRGKGKGNRGKAKAKA
jgi:hypothetical protein